MKNRHVCETAKNSIFSRRDCVPKMHSLGLKHPGPSVVDLHGVYIT